MKSFKIFRKLSFLANIGLIGVVSLSTQSCNDLLTENVVSRIGNDYINTAKGLNDATSAAYSTMRSWYGTERGMNLTVFGTDSYQNGADGSWKFMNTYTTDFDTRNGLLPRCGMIFTKVSIQLMPLLSVLLRLQV